MFQCERKTRVWSASLTLVLCAMIADPTVAAPPTLESVAVTPASSSISVGQTQRFKATGTFSDGSARVLGPAISDIAPGDFGTCVLLVSGGVKCWGVNEWGQLGDGSTVDSLIPRRVKAITDATAVAFASTHGCALLGSGAVRCWGGNDMGALGNGTTTSSAVPVAVTGINSATALAIGANSSCALLAGGALQCWGWNLSYTIPSSSIPVSVLSNVTAVAARLWHICAVLASGAVQCWGANSYGQLGNGTNTDSDTPVTVVGIHSAKSIAVGMYSSCALLTNGAVQCWGNGGGGQLGNGRYEDSNIPVPVALTGTADAITAGRSHACAVMSSGAALCWGDNALGQLGTGTAGDSPSTPVRVRGITAPVRLAAARWHTCALLSDGAMRCWGYNASGQLGNRRRTGTTPNSWPVNVIGTPGVVWQSSDPTKATVFSSGRATGRAVGNTTITATTVGFINDNAVLTVK